MNFNSKDIIIGSRTSLLARKHIEIFEQSLKKKIDSSMKIKIEKKFYKTIGDKFLTSKISEIGNKGLFSKEIDEALLNFEINLGIHSLKDLPTSLPKGLEIAAILKREDFRDIIISNKELNLKNMKKNSIIGTSSIRREMQLKKIRPDFIFKQIRGNIDSRINKVNKNQFDAIVIAYAGVKRLGIFNYKKTINPNTLVPALGQGAIALVVNSKNQFIKNLIRRLNHKKTFIETNCERIFLKALDGNCKTPVGGYAILLKQGNEKKIYFNFIAFSQDGKIVVKDSTYFKLNSYESESFELGVKIKKKISR